MSNMWRVINTCAALSGDGARHDVDRDKAQKFVGCEK